MRELAELILQNGDSYSHDEIGGYIITGNWQQDSDLVTGDHEPFTRVYRRYSHIHEVYDTLAERYLNGSEINELNDLIVAL